MPAMSDFHPECCAPLREHWPLPLLLPDVRLVSTRYDVERLQASDFADCAIPGVAGAGKRQCEYLAGRLCARHALHLLTGQASIPAVGADRAPQWPAGVTGSITHSHGQAAALVAGAAHWRGLGMDLEPIMTAARSQRLAGEILTTDELQRLARVDPALHPWLVSLTFSAKESLFKALYPLVGQRFYFQHAELLEWTAEGRLRLGLLKDLNGDWRRGTTLEGQFGELDGQLLTLVGIAAGSSIVG